MESARARMSELGGALREGLEEIFRFTPDSGEIIKTYFKILKRADYGKVYDTEIF